MRLKDKVAIITGGGGGIGRAIALRFKEEGAKIIVSDKDSELGKETVRLIEEQQGTAIFQYADMSKPEDVEVLMKQAITTFGKINILCNNAGIVSEEKKLPDVTVQEWQRVIDINLSGTFLGMKYALPHMKSGSSIVNTASIAGIKGQKLLASYSASKSSVIALTKTAATEFGGQNIRVNAIAPGIIDTKMADGWKASTKWSVLSTANALRRVGEPAEIAHAVLFLASDEASFITGETLVIDGGTLNL